LIVSNSTSNATPFLPTCATAARCTPDPLLALLRTTPPPRRCLPAPLWRNRKRLQHHILEDDSVMEGDKEESRVTMELDALSPPTSQEIAPSSSSSFLSSNQVTPPPPACTTNTPPTTIPLPVLPSRMTPKRTRTPPPSSAFVLPSTTTRRAACSRYLKG